MNQEAAPAGKALLGEMLTARGLVSPEDVDKALQIQASVGGRLGALLVRIGAISEDQLLGVLAEQLSVVYLRSGEEMPDNLLVFQFMHQSPIKLDWFLDHSVLLWSRDNGSGDGELCCVARDMLDHGLTELLNYFYPQQSVTFFLMANHQLDKLLEFVRKERAIEHLFSPGNAKQLREMAEEAPVIELVNNLLAQAVDVGASDVHVEPSEENFTVRLRVDGVLHTRLTQPADRFPAVASRIKLISGIDIAERRLPQDGRITTRISGSELDIRVSTVPCVHGESIVLRLLPKDRDELSLGNLGMEKDHLAMFRAWLKSNNGIVLVTGPTGSGKSTTLYSALDDTNDGINKILTVEDPVEYQLAGITQIQAHAEIGYTFARALRAILRQDPDIIMIGEIRDLETAEIAIQSALTGHLVLSTVHTNDAVSSFTRLIDMGVEPFLVSAPMRGVQAQRLVRKVCSHCSELVAVPDAVQVDLALLPADLLGNSWKESKGCKLCHGSGFNGRMGIYELVPMSTELQDMIVAGATLNELKTLVVRQGHRSLYQDGLIKASRGETTLEEVTRLTLSE
ncbi:MAG: Flp pilus assembly complex ATPase component TadA [Pseudomonadales bacterium]|nr:Flp pilus assembly complex ATPase component TadA [Pseudomonadales bacterium]